MREGRIRDDDVAQRPTAIDGVEGVAGHERHAWLVALERDARLAAVDDPPLRHFELDDAAIRALDGEAVALCELAQHCEVSVPVTGDDAVAGLAGEHARGIVRRTEGEIASARAGEHEECRCAARQAQTCDGKSIRPGPGACSRLAVAHTLPGGRNEPLCELRLHVNPAGLRQTAHTEQQECCERDVRQPQATAGFHGTRAARAVLSIAHHTNAHSNESTPSTRSRGARVAVVAKPVVRAQ